MADNIYDIFISYRRDCSASNAKILQNVYVVLMIHQGI